QTAKKVIRAQRIAFECSLPIVYLVDSAGVFLPMQDEIFPDEDDFGRIFRNNSVISAAGVPQYAAIMGNCVAGGAYLPVLCDKLLMTKGSELYLAGPALVKAAIGQQVDSEELGGAKMHAQISGTVDFYEESDEACLKQLRKLVDLLPTGDKLVNAVSNSTVPKTTVIVGGSFGAGNYALCGKAFDPVFIFAWPSAKYAVMGADQAAGTLVQIQQRQAERAGKKLSQEDIDVLRERITKDYQTKTDIRYG